MLILHDINTFLFADESKFSINDNDKEDSIFYFAVSVSKVDDKKIRQQYIEILNKFEVTDRFHANKIFKEKNPNKDLMYELCDLININRLKCYCFKYSRSFLYEACKGAFLDNTDEIFDFNNMEFQALFLFVENLNSYLKNDCSINTKALVFLDRNVYGINDIEGFDYRKDESIKRMIFLSKKKINLLGLPDYLGYIFRKSKISFNKVELGDASLEKSVLNVCCCDCLLKINHAKLFYFLDVDEWLKS